MAEQSTPPTKAQLDKSEREHLEDVVIELRETVEADVKYQLEHTYELDEEDGGENLFGEEADTRAELVRAVKREDENKDWEEKFDQYVMGVGYTIINRLTALRCMEVRGFIERPVTQFGDSGTTPAAEKLETEEFLSPEEAIIEAYERECAKLTGEIEILFDPDSPYSIIDPGVETFEELCKKLDEVPDPVWRADDVLGWVYEYYNASKLDELRRKGDREGLAPEDVPPANQFYTPHWVVRMLTDNSLTKMYLESKGELLSTIEEQQNLSIEERKFRNISPEETPSLAEFSTYLVPTEEEGKAPDLNEPEEIRIIDPACGSGHFLLYAFDILERIWHRERPDLDRAEIPTRILRHNLYGIDLDLRACQLAAFNLYLKARARSEEEGKDNFEMPEIGIVCADVKIANVEAASEVFDEVAGDQPEVRDALEEILGAFENVQGLGSLLDVKGTLEQEFTMEEQPTLMEAISGPGSLSKFLEDLHQEVINHRNGESFLAQDLRSFLRVLVILTQEYDVALMNPPYGSRNRMPKKVKSYVDSHYKYTPEYYINFFEVCESLVKYGGRVGMLVPRSFMFKRSYEDFRKDFVGDQGAFDFLAEFGLGVLDNATVRTVGTVVRPDTESDQSGTFIRLYDVKTHDKERVFVNSVYNSDYTGIKRLFNVELKEFREIPKYPLNFGVPSEIRELHSSDIKVDPEAAGLSGQGISKIAQGLATGDNPRFIRQHWEVPDIDYYEPITKGGSDAWIMPHVTNVVNFNNNGREMRPLIGSRIQNEQYYREEGLTWTYIKETGDRFGYLPSGSLFDQTGSMVFPEQVNQWTLLSVLNSQLYHGLFLSLTPGRHWTPGVVGRIPWREELSDLDELKEISQEQYKIIMKEKTYETSSPYYIGPRLLPEDSTDGFFHENHEFLARDEIVEEVQFESGDRSDSIEEMVAKANTIQNERNDKLSSLKNRSNKIIYDRMGISSKARKENEVEVSLRTSESENGDGILDNTLDSELLTKKLVHYAVLRAIQDSSTGIIPLNTAKDSKSILGHIIEQFNIIYGEYAEQRLVEVDQILGDQRAVEKAYPNLEDWLTNDFYQFHIREMENTPLLIYLTTKRTVSNPEAEAFGCLIDYHRISADIFDKLDSNFLEPLKSEIREKRNNADQRRSDNTLSTSEQADAAEEFAKYEDMLSQIDKFQDAALKLSSKHTRDWSEDKQIRSAKLAEKVSEFRERIRERLETLDQLVEQMDPDEFEELFSPTFLERVNENRDEWIEALDDLETACRAYSVDVDQPIEAHLYDLFPYFEDIIGSTHYSSNGIFFMNYYFSKGEKYLDAGVPREGLDGEVRLLAELAAETDEDVALGKEIKKECNELTELISSDWQERALSEVMTAGYDPVKKHGVAINIQPLAKKKIVPEIVEDKVTN